MGAWGYFSDENDDACDLWMEVEKQVMPEYFEKLYKLTIQLDDDVYDAIKTIVRGYYAKHISKVFSVVKKLVASLKKDLSKSKTIKDTEFVHMAIVGLCLKLANFMDSLENKGNKTGLPKKLHKNYPKSLQNSALKSLEALLESIDDNNQGWKDIKIRKKYLNCEIKLFSNKN